MSGERALSFFGAAGTVTGAKFLVEDGGRKILLDGGLFQGLKALRLRNWAEPPFEARQLDAVVLSHAHIDHSGALPLLVRRGFRGPIHCTAGTAELLGVLLRDSARLQEEDAARANRYRYSKHSPARPLYSLDDVEATLERVESHAYEKAFSVGQSARARLRRAGHILGAASVELEVGRRDPVRVVYSGDLGRRGRPILRDPEPVRAADVLLVESTYGDREHPAGADERLATLVKETVARDGVLLVPSFAVGRAQELLWLLRTLEERGEIPKLPVFLDSPMAIDVTAIYLRHPQDHDLEMQKLVDVERNPLHCARLRLVRTAEESRALNRLAGPMILIAGSGMATGGRILHHLKLRLPDRRNTVLLPGFQAAGTRGRSLAEGAASLRIHGEDVPVKARVELLDGLSAHADRRGILDWLRGFAQPPRRTYVVHGEPAAAQALAASIRAELGWETSVAADGERVEL